MLRPAEENAEGAAQIKPRPPVHVKLALHRPAESDGLRTAALFTEGRRHAQQHVAEPQLGSGYISYRQSTAWSTQARIVSKSGLLPPPVVLGKSQCICRDAFRPRQTSSESAGTRTKIASQVHVAAIDERLPVR